MLKSQTVRLWDVAVFGPLTLYAGWELRKKRPWLAVTMAAFGVGTIAYNAVNYVRYSQLAPQPTQQLPRTPDAPSPQSSIPQPAQPGGTYV